MKRKIIATFCFPHYFRGSPNQNTYVIHIIIYFKVKYFLTCIENDCTMNFFYYFTCSNLRISLFEAFGGLQDDVIQMQFY